MLGQQILNGLVTGSVYALFALGFTLVFGIYHILNLAHGAVFMWGAFCGLYLVKWGAPLYLALPLAMVAGGVLACLLELIAFRPLRKRHATEFAALVSSIGANLILISIAQQVSQSRIYRFPADTFPYHLFTVLGLRVTLLQLSIVSFLVIVIALLALYVYRTSFGRQLRAVAVNERTALLLGVNPSSVHLQVFFISGALAGVTGVLIGIAFNSVHFLMGEPYMLRAFAVIVVGGMGSIEGAIVAGLLLGLIQTLTGMYLSSNLADSLTFLLLFLMLMFRPSGLFPGLVRSPERTRR